KVLAPITGGNLKLKLGGASDPAYVWLWGPAAPNGDVIAATPGWTTITVPLSGFTDDWGLGTNTITNLNDISGNFGMVFDNGSSTVNFMVDNVRFHKTN